MTGLRLSARNWFCIRRRAPESVTFLRRGRDCGGEVSKTGKQELEKKRLEFAQERMKMSRFSVLVGFEVERLYEGGAVLGMSVRDDHRQIHSVVHGGVIAALADTAAAIAAYTVTPQGVELVTIELKINYLLPIAEGRVKAEGKVLRAGRNFVVVECDVRNDKRDLAAKALMTFGAAGVRPPETQNGFKQADRSGRDPSREPKAKRSQ
jgi:uncharacterized protein (TIGR00369 family)